jgi:hypothetical protein
MYTTHNVRWSFQLYAINVDLVYNESWPYEFFILFLFNISIA